MAYLFMIKKYLKTKVREYDGEIKTIFLGNDVPKENMHYTCTAYITIDSIMKMDKKYFLQVYLEECKYKIRNEKYTKYQIRKYKCQDLSMLN